MIYLIRAGKVAVRSRSVMGYLSYPYTDPKNISETYPVWGWRAHGYRLLSCFYLAIIFGEEPKRVSALIEQDPEIRTDVLTSAILHFPLGQAVLK